MQSEIIHANVLPEFLDLYGDKYRYIVYFSGRSVGKSYAVAMSQLTRGMSHKMRFLDAREIQKSIEKSVKTQLESLIEEYGWQRYFESQRDKLICTTTGSEWSFIGLKDNPTKVQSYTG